MMEQVKDFAANVYEALSTPQQLEKWLFSFQKTTADSSTSKSTLNKSPIQFAIDNLQPNA